MTRFGKKLLSAFVEVSEEEKSEVGDVLSAGKCTADGLRQTGSRPDAAGDHTDDRFAGHFDKLLSEANIPGPDYYEFSRMVGVMQGIPDETARYTAAYAGLQVQGLDKKRLLETAAEYLRLLAKDADQFQKTVDAAMEEKVQGKEAEAEEKAARIRALTQEVLQLQQQITALQEEIRVNREKLVGGSGSYAAESGRRQEEIRRDMEKINQYIH